MRPLRVTAVALAALAGTLPAQPPRGDHNHWVLLSKSGEPREPVRFGSDARYFLNTYRLNKLAVDTKVAEGMTLLRLASGQENLVFYNPGAGDTVRLNNPVAIYVYSRRAFLVHQTGPRWELGLVDWEPSREPPQPRPANIYQWRFERPPELAARDHRTPTLGTREELALYNLDKRAFLVYVREKGALRWNP